MQTSKYTASQIVHQTLQKEGWRAFYKGLGPVIVGGVPGVCMYLTSYEYCKDQLSTYPSIPPVLTYVSAALTAETFCCLVFVPVDVLKERMQVNKQALQYTSTAQSLYHIIENEGLRGLYKGYGATLASYGPFACIYFSLYEMVINL